MYDGRLFLKLVISVIIVLHHKWHADVVIHEASLTLSYQMNFVDDAIDTCALIVLNFKERIKERKIDEFMLPLEVLAVIPLDH